jgi:multiple sugar transport system permease protein
MLLHIMTGESVQTEDAPVTTARRQSWRRKMVPYLLIAPAFIYLAMFFAYPMFQGLILAIYDDEAVLPVVDEPTLSGSEVGRLPQGASIEILGRQGNLLGDDEGTDLLTELWYFVSVEQPDGSTAEGWVSEARVRVREEADDGTPLAGTIRPRLGENADPLTRLRVDPNETAEVVAEVEERAVTNIVEVATLEVWFQIRDMENPDTAAGWAPSRFIQVFDDDVTGRVDRGNAGEYTTDFITKMLDDRFFGPALRTTLLLMVLIIPAQFVLAMLMALVIHARIKFSSGFLYVFSLPMGMSDLAAGILFFSIFTGSG